MMLVRRFVPIKTANAAGKVTYQGPFTRKNVATPAATLNQKVKYAYTGGKRYLLSSMSVSLF
jgi:hypothetical protein